MSSSGNYDKYITMAASVAATAIVVRSVVNELLPCELRDLLYVGVRFLRSRVSSRHTLVIDEAEGLSTNQIYDAVRAYLASRISTDMPRLRVSRVDEAQGIMVSMEQGEEMVDVHDGVEYTWSLISRDSTPRAAAGTTSAYGGHGAKGRGRRPQIKSFEVSFHKKHKEKALNSYLPFVVAIAKAIEDQHRNLKMHMVEYDAWTAVDLRHPSTFDTLAMDHKLKQSVVDDLERFVRRKDYYKRIGRAWKRGYLLYGPPGTGKSSLIAAMANYLKFDIYDLELTEVKCNSDLRRLLIGMSNRSILVVEDIDCGIELQQREEGEKRAKPSHAGEESDNKVTLSGLLNLVDGLWSTSGEERIIVFTTNYRERLDPALLRPGRMDMHIHMGYCTPESFRILARNYHSVENHAMYPEIEQLMKEVMVSPAEVAEVLMRNDNSDVVLRDLLEFLKAKMKEAGESKAANEQMKKCDGETII
ncbi:AAA-ATPase At3g50940-like [Phragmites australis]|uniref:AAA-ATPase At3g50940-like n=1 Tax=Phragmites australis TaxID=29695 RepID=UPI002D7664CC|nr:AAA-ATPase At3g50940-like [Phragmites australis]